MDSIEGRNAEGKGVSGVGVLDKAVVILSFISERGPATLAEVVGGTGLPRPTAHRLLSALEAHRLVGRNDGRYSLGVRLLGWGSGAVGLDLVEAARPVLAVLRDESGESAQLYVSERLRRKACAPGGGLWGSECKLIVQVERADRRSGRNDQRREGKLFAEAL